MQRFVVACAWIGLYVVLALAPLLLLLADPPSERRDLWTEASVGLAFVGLSMLFLQFALTARFHRVAAPYGVDMILQFHRQISLVAVGFIVLHVAIILVRKDDAWALLSPSAGPWASRAGSLALMGLLALIAMSLWRKQLRLRYETWRVGHGLLAIAVLGLAMAHVMGAGIYLDLPWKRLLWGAMAVGAVGLVAWIRLARPMRLQRRPWTVEGVHEDRGGVWRMVLRPEGHDGMRFAPGQFAWLTLDRSPLAIREHPFSFASSAQERDRVEFGIKALGDFTSSIPHLAPGTKAYLDGPFGVFTPDRYAHSDLLLVAGGIGITPMMSILRTLADREDRRQVLLIFGNESWDEVHYREEIQALQGRLELRVEHVLQEPPNEWEGETGYVDRDLLDRHLPQERAGWRAFLCGPPPMMETVKDALLELGMPRQRIHQEFFELV